MSSHHSHKKQARAYTCTIVIGQIIVHDNFDSSYFAKWKRGKESGATEYCLCNNEGTVDVQKKFTFDVDLSNKKQNLKLTISVFRFTRKAKKIGKIKIDLMQYINKPAEMGKIIDLISSLADTPKICISIYSSSKMSQDEQFNPALDDLTSIIDATQELATMSAIHEVTKQTNLKKTGNPFDAPPKLAQMVQIDPRASQAPMSNLDSRRQKATSMKLLNSFLSTSGTSGPSSVKRTPSTFNMPPIAQANEAPLTSSQSYEVVSDVLSNFDHLLSQKVDYTDKLVRSFEGPDSFIFAQCLFDDIFLNMRESHFQSVMNTLPTKIIESPILSTYNDDRRRFFPLYGLSALLYRPPANAEVNTDRTKALFKAIQSKTLECLKTVISSYVTLFEVQVKKIIEHKAGNDETIEDFNRLLDAYLVACQAPKEFEKILTYSIISAIDVMFVTRMLKIKRITFMDSIPWNSFCTRFRENSQYELQLFSQMVCVIQMTTAIDNDNQEIENICEDLTPMAVLQVLKRRAVDDTLEKPPDLEKFAATYSLNLEETTIDADKLTDWKRMLRLSYKSVNTDEWKDVNIPTQFRLDFPCIQKFFNE